MDFQWTKEQEDIRKAARKFAEGEFPNFAKECDKKEEYPKELWKKACELGFVGIFIDEKYGGPGFGFTEACIIMEEFWRVDPGCGNIVLAAFGTEIIQKFGTEEQKKKYLPLVPAGKAIMATAVTEPDAGSDIFMGSTTAVRDGGEYVINGNKTFITNGSIGNLVIVYCKTEPKSKDRYKGNSFFVVETDRKGFEANKITGKMGIRASDTAELSFSDVRVPEQNLIGGVEGEGFSQVMYLFNINRTFAAAQGIGVAQGAFEKAIAYVKQRKQFGKTISSFQGTQFRIADMITKIEVARNMVYKACWLLDNGQFNPLLIAISKLYAGEIAVKVVDEALQMFGGYGYIAEYDVERFYRDAKVIEIYEGTKEIEKITIAREVLGRGLTGD